MNKLTYTHESALNLYTAMPSYKVPESKVLEKKTKKMHNRNSSLGSIAGNEANDRFKSIEVEENSVSGSSKVD